MKKLTSIIWAIVLAIISFLGTMASIVNMDPSSGRTIFIVIALSVFPVGLCVILLLRVIESWKPISLHILRTCKTKGIANIYPTGKGSVALAANLSGANDIRIMVTSGLGLFSIHRNEIVRALRDNHAQVRIFIAKPDSEYIRDHEKIEGLTDGQYNSEIKSVEGVLQKFVNEAESSKEKGRRIGNLFVGYYTTQIKSAMILCGDSWGWLSLFLPPKWPNETTSFELIAAKDGLLSDCITHFDESWKLAEARNLVREIKPQNV